MTKYIGCLILGAVFCLPFIGQAQQPRSVTTPSPVVTHYPGRVVQVQSSALHRFNHPVAIAPRVLPPTVPAGHHWRWHPHFGFVALPVAVSANSVVLPADYTLPNTVTAYQAHAECQTVCPHCGQVLSISVK